MDMDKLIHSVPEEEILYNFNNKHHHDFNEEEKNYWRGIAEISDRNDEMMEEQLLEQQLTVLRNSFLNGLTQPLEFRKKQIQGILKLVDENKDALIDALSRDAKKSKTEVIGEIEILKNDALHMIYNISRLVKPKNVASNLPNMTAQAQIVPEPYGVVLVIGAWNYPLVLALTPLIGAIAAGNCVVTKPSDMSPATAQLIAKLLPQYIDKNWCIVFQGGPTETQRLLENRFDYIFYTGSTRVGRIIAETAAKHFTPVTLELGGKSPCYLDSSVDIDIVASRIVWGKCFNSGQACIAPDYVLCSQDLEKKFIEAFKKAQKEQFGLDMKTSPDYGRIINKNHFNRLVGLLEGQEIASGGKYDANELYMELTICTNVDPKSDLMKEEIFGPILPIIRVKDALEAIRFINSGEKPLALYVFSNKKKVVDLFIERTSSGGVCVNDTLMHFSCESLPFGGVGHSGIGAYHGDLTFDTFCHKKPVLKQSMNSIVDRVISIRYAPFSDRKTELMKLLLKKRRNFVSTQFLLYIFFIFVGCLITYVYLECGESIVSFFSSLFKK